MRQLDIELTDEETTFLSRIKFKPEREDWILLLEPMAELTESLLDRGAVPPLRLLYFTDAERNPGCRGKSREDIFIGNGTEGDEILRHPNFLKILDNFLFGPNLPAYVISKFKNSMSSGHLSGGDVNELTPYARKITRDEGLESHQAAEEFYKLVLECQGPTYAAESLGKSVLAIR
jgi:hypothetical protein